MSNTGLQVVSMLNISMDTAVKKKRVEEERGDFIIHVRVRI